MVQKILNLQKSTGLRRALRGLVLSPTADLTKQTLEFCLKFCSGLSVKPSLLDKSRAAGSNFSFVDVLFAQPLRLSLLIERGRIPTKDISFLAIDEVDRMLDLQFADQVEDVLGQSSLRKTCTRCLLSATMPSHIEILAKTILIHPLTLKIGVVNTAVTNVRQELLLVTNEAGKRLEMFQMRNGARNIASLFPMLVFVASSDRSVALCSQLKKVFGKDKVDSIHTNQTLAKRNQILHNFHKQIAPILITTDVMARGIDFRNVKNVVQYDFPQTSIDYIHRVGRAGRAGKTGDCITFVADEDLGSAYEVATTMRRSGCLVPDRLMEKATKSRGLYLRSGKKGQRFRRPQPPELISSDPRVRQKAEQMQRIIEAKRKKIRSKWIGQRKRIQERKSKRLHRNSLSKGSKSSTPLRDDSEEIDSRIADLGSTDSNMPQFFN